MTGTPAPERNPRRTIQEACLTGVIAFAISWAVEWARFRYIDQSLVNNSLDPIFLLYTPFSVTIVFLVSIIAIFRAGLLRLLWRLWAGDTGISISTIRLQSPIFRRMLWLVASFATASAIVFLIYALASLGATGTLSFPDALTLISPFVNAYAPLFPFAIASLYIAEKAVLFFRSLLQPFHTVPHPRRGYLLATACCAVYLTIVYSFLLLPPAAIAIVFGHVSPVELAVVSAVLASLLAVVAGWLRERRTAR